MSELYEKLVEVIGDEEKAKAAQSALGEFMIPKSEYAKLRDSLKTKDSELEQMRVASMDNDQKLQHELAKAEAVQRDFITKTNKLEAEQLFVSAGLTKETYATILENSVSDDREKTMNLVNGFVSILSKEKENVANKTKEDIVNSTPKPIVGNEIKGTESKSIKVKTTF